MTEASHQMASNPLPPAARKPGTVGLPAGPEIRVADERGDSVPAGSKGEIVIRGGNVMAAYENNPDANATGFIDGWFRTGDVGTMDDEGYLSIVGRARDVLRTGGETVAPGEVEAVLAGHPAVGEVAVVGLPDPQWGEVVCAVVVPVDGRRDDVSVDSLRAHCEGRLASFKQPRQVELVDSLPRTPATGQIQRTLLVERLTATRAT